MDERHTFKVRFFFLDAQEKRKQVTFTAFSKNRGEVYGNVIG